MVKKPHIFYGWWILAACFMMGMYSSGIIYYGFTALFDPIVKEFGWSYEAVSWAASLRGMETGLLAPLVGYLVDRFGARPVLFAGGIFTGFGVLALSQVNSLLMFYAAFGLVCIGLSAVSSTSMIAVLVKWFHRRSSMVMGIMISGFGLSGFMIPVVVRLIDILGWREALFILGLGMFVVVLPLSIMVRRRPEDYGLLPDGDAGDLLTNAVQNTAVKPKAENNIGLKKALHAPIFWYFALAFMLQQLITSAVTTHVMPYLASVEVTRDIGGLIATGIPVVSIVGRLSFGWLGDKMDNKRLTAAGFVMLCAGLLLFSYVGTGWGLLIMFVIIFGTGFGGTNTMRAVLTRDLFGSQNFATIYGFVCGVGAVGSLIGAPLAGYVYDTMSSYRPIWLIFTVLTIVCIAAMLFMPTAKAKKL